MRFGRQWIGLTREARALVVALGLALTVAMGAVAAPAFAQTTTTDEIAQRLAATSPVSWSEKEHEGHKTVAVQILSINDFHGQIGAGKKVSSRPVGSAPVLASYLETAEQGMENSTLLVSAGDMVGASPAESALLQDEPTVMFFNMMGNKFARTGKWGIENPRNNLVAAPGNHEFDEGVAELQRLLYGGNYPTGPFLQNPWRGAAFPMVAANITRTDSGRTLFRPYSIKEVNGERIAFIGATLHDTPTIVMPSGVAGLTFGDEADAINKQVKAVQKQGVHSIVVVLHQGGYQTSYDGLTDASKSPVTGDDMLNILKRLDGDVDVVVTGHSHGFTNALVPNAAGKNMLVVQAWSSGTAYADVDLQIDRETHDIVAKTGSIVTTWADAGPGLTPDPKVTALVSSATAKVAPLVNRVVGTAASAITRTQNSAGESALGNLIADAQRAAMNTDFAFMNPGGIRADIVAGPVTWGNLFTVQPFGNVCTKITMTGQQVYDVLNQQFASLRMLQISGLTYTWDSTLPAAGRVIDVRKGGVSIDKTAAYSVVINNYLADGGDGFSVFKLGTNRSVGPTDLDALVQYLPTLTQPFSAAIEGRVTRLP